MATTFKYVQGDTGPQIKVTLTEEDSGDAVDLTGATVTLHFRAAGEDSVLFSREFYVNPDTAENGIAVLQWETNDLNQVRCLRRRDRSGAVKRTTRNPL